MRDSGIMATPREGCAAGSPASRPAGTRTAVRRPTGAAPKIARASSVRPAPTSPARPTISPARTSKRDVGDAAGAQVAHREHDGRVRGRRRRLAGTSRSAAGRASPRSASPRSRRRSAPSERRARRGGPSPSSASSSTSRRKCEIRTTVVPPAASPRTISCSCCVSRLRQRRGRLVHDDELRASATSARRISTFCCSAVRSRRRRGLPGSSKPAVAASSAYLAARAHARATKPPRRGSAPRKTFSATVSCGTMDGSWAIADDAALERLPRRAERDGPPSRSIWPCRVERARDDAARASTCRRRSRRRARAPSLARRRARRRRAPERLRSAWRRPGARGARCYVRSRRPGCAASRATLP